MPSRKENSLSKVGFLRLYILWAACVGTHAWIPNGMAGSGIFSRQQLWQTRGMDQYKMRINATPSEYDDRTNIVGGRPLDSCEYAKKIKTYGEQRMAKRAVEVLKKMAAHKVYPQEEHYTEAIWACENSSQYKLALSVLDEMKAEHINPSIRTYNGLISLAEKTDHWDDALGFYDILRRDGIMPDHDTCNAILMAYDRLGDIDSALKMLDLMKEKGIERDVTTYTACIHSCDQSGDGLLAIELLEEMQKDGIALNTKSCNAALWACLHGGYAPHVFGIINKMEAYDVEKDEMTYKAAIWASEMESDAKKAVKWLRLMKFNKKNRDAMAFDGALSAVCKEDDWKLAQEMLRWMDQDSVLKSPVTYKLAVDILDKHKEYNMAEEVYLSALRDGYYSPWIPKTRKMDLRGFPLSMAKVALKTVLISFLDGRQVAYALTMIVGDIKENGDGDYPFNPDEFRDFLRELSIQETFPGANHPVEIASNTDHLPHVLETVRSVDTEEGVELLTIERDTLVKWMGEIE